MNVKIARITKNLTQAQLAKMVGVSHVTISRIEKGKIEEIRFGTLKKIAAALDSTVSELFF